MLIALQHQLDITSIPSLYLQMRHHGVVVVQCILELILWMVFDLGTTERPTDFRRARLDWSTSTRYQVLVSHTYDPDQLCGFSHSVKSLGVFASGLDLEGIRGVRQTS